MPVELNWREIPLLRLHLHIYIGNWQVIVQSIKINKQYTVLKYSAGTVTIHVKIKIRKRKEKILIKRKRG